MGKKRKAGISWSALSTKVASIAGWSLWIITAFLIVNIVIALVLLLLQHYQLINIKKLDTVTTLVVNATMYILMSIVAIWLPLRSRRRKLLLDQKSEADPQKTRRENIKFVLDLAGLSRRPKLIDLSYFLADLPVFYLVSMIASYVAVFILNPEIMGQEQSLDFAKTGNAWWQLVIIFVAYVVLAPLFEEILMRGLLFKKVRKNAPFIVTSIVVSLLFAVAHGQINVGIMTFIMSMFCCWIREKTDATWGGIFLHATNNFVAFTLLYLVN